MFLHNHFAPNFYYHYSFSLDFKLFRRRMFTKTKNKNKNKKTKRYAFENTNCHLLDTLLALLFWGINIFDLRKISVIFTKYSFLIRMPVHYTHIMIYIQELFWYNCNFCIYDQIIYVWCYLYFCSFNVFHLLSWNFSDLERCTIHWFTRYLKINLMV